MAALIFARLAFGVKKIADRRTTEGDSFAENILERFAEFHGFLPGEIRRDSFWVNARAPETFVGIDIANAAEGTLIEQECFDP